MVTAPLERFLQPNVVLKTLYEKMVPHLQFLPMVNPIRETSTTFPYKYNDYSMSSDPKKETPPVAIAGTRFPEMDWTRPSVGSKATEEHGFAMRLTHDLMKLRNEKSAQEIIDATERAGYWMAEVVNAAILAGMKTSGNYTSLTWATVTWDDATGTATPIKDLATAKKTYRHAGYPYRLNTVLAHLDNWTELQNFVRDYDNRWLVGGVPVITEDTIYIPSVNLTVHCVDEGITDFSEGSMIGLDKNNIVAEWHYFTDSLYAPQTVSYDTLDASGKIVRKTVNNIGIHYRLVRDEIKDDTILEFYYDGKLTVTNAYGIAYGTGV